MGPTAMIQQAPCAIRYAGYTVSTSPLAIDLQQKPSCVVPRTTVLVSEYVFSPLQSATYHPALLLHFRSWSNLLLSRRVYRLRPPSLLP
jgi:hypothetical protein